MKNLTAFKSLLQKPFRGVIITHFRPDADGLGASLGLAGYLKKKGHSIQVITPSTYPDFLSWMPGNDDVLALSSSNRKKEQMAKQFIAEADVIFCLDFSNLDRINDLKDATLLSTAKKVLIDHHLDPDDFADFVHWDVDAASTAGLVFELINSLGDKMKIDSNIANCLYAGLLTDTGGFRHANTTKKEFFVASELVGAGATPAYVSKKIYDSNTLVRIRFMGFVLHKRLVVLPKYSAAYISISSSDLVRFSLQVGDTEGLVNYGLSIAGIRLAVLMYDRKEEIKLSFRSLGDFPANEIAKKYFNGGGHKNAAGGTSKQTLEQTQQKFLSILVKYKDQLNQTI